LRRIDGVALRVGRDACDLRVRHRRGDVALEVLQGVERAGLVRAEIQREIVGKRVDDLPPDARVRWDLALHRTHRGVAAERCAVGGSLDRRENRAVTSRTGRECGRKSDREPSIASHFE
jgi:hypothetical protein